MTIRQIFLVIFLYVVAHPAQAGDYIYQRGLLIDHRVDMTIQEVAKAKFAPATEVLSLGHTDSASWLKLRIRPREDGGKLILSVGPTFLDQVTLYQPDPKAPGGWLEQINGDKVPWDKRPFTGVGVRLNFSIHPQQETTYYLRLVTTSTGLMLVNALTPEEANFANLRRLGWEVFCLVFISLILAWAVFDYMTYPQPVVGWFMLTEITFLLYSFVMLGYLAPLLPKSQHIDLLTNLLMFSAVLSQIIFNHQMLAPFRPPRFWLHLFELLAVTDLIVISGLFLNHVQHALQINATIALILGLMVLPAALMARQDAVLKRQALRIPYALKTLVWLTFLLPILGVGRGSEYNIYGALVIGMISAGLMGYLLIARSIAQQRQWKIDANEHQRSLITLDEQRKWLKEQSLMLSMLSHELKTPLSVIRSVLGVKSPTPELKQRGVQSINEMTRLLDKGSMVSKMESGALSLVLADCDLAQLLVNIVDAMEEPDHFRLRLQAFPIIHTDSALLRIILNNLVENAAKYSDPDRPVEIILDDALDEGGVRVTVANFPGLAGWPEPDNLFNKYHRGPKARQVSGSGLGLYLAMGFATLIGARLSYRPTEQQIRFCLVLPRSICTGDSQQRHEGE